MERPRPDIDSVRDAMRERDEREADDEAGATTPRPTTAHEDEDETTRTSRRADLARGGRRAAHRQRRAGLHGRQRRSRPTAASPARRAPTPSRRAPRAGTARSRARPAPPSAGTRGRAGARARRRRRGGARTTRRRRERTRAARASAPWRLTSHATVSAPLKSSRSTMSPVPEPPACGPAAVATVPAAIVTKPSANSAHTARATPSRRRARPASHAGRARQNSTHAGHDHHHREDQVGHHPAGREAVEHGQPAHHGLAERRRAAAAPPSSARSRRNGRRAKASTNAATARDPDDAGQQPVAELDVGVGAELGRQAPVLVAVGPVRAAEAGAGDAHGRAGEDDQHERARARREATTRYCCGVRRTRLQHRAITRRGRRHGASRRRARP